MATKHILIAGAAGMVGAATCSALKHTGYQISGITRATTDFTDRRQVDNMYQDHGADCVIVAAAKVGGIHANNTYPADFLYDNLAIEANLIDGAYRAGIHELIFLGSSCIYPKHAAQPMAEEELLTGVLEPTNEPYAVAKIAGIKLCESYRRQYGVDYRSLMPTNLYGQHDNFHAEDSHVIPALMRRFHEAKQHNSKTVVIWGTGKAKREFLHVDDLAEAIVHVLTIPADEYWSLVSDQLSHLNVGTGVDVTIRELASLVQQVVGHEGEVVFDPTKSDGAPRKLLDVSKLSGTGWQPKISLAEGLASTYAWYVSNVNSARGI